MISTIIDLLFLEIRKTKPLQVNEYTLLGQTFGTTWLICLSTLIYILHTVIQWVGK